MLTSWDGVVLSVHANWRDCRETLRAPTHTLRELMRREREAGNPPTEMPSSYMCRPASDTIDPRWLMRQ